MINSKLSHGMVPSDILIRTAIKAALDDLRKNPFLLDYCFNWLENDELTAQEYGRKEKQRAKDWFLKTEIGVAMNYRTDDPKFPLIAIGLQASVEDLSTLGDVNYDTSEDVSASEVSVDKPSILGPFTPAQFDMVNGIVTLPDGFTTDSLFENNIIVDTSNNKGYIVRAITSSNTFTIDPNITANFTNCYIAPFDSFYIAALESCLFKQTYSIKCFAQSDAMYVVYLHTVLEFILLRYKELLLEGRGFDRSIISSGPLYLYQETDKEKVFGRDVTLTGYCRQYWPKLISPKIQGVQIDGLQIIGGTGEPVLFTEKSWGIPLTSDMIIPGN